MSLFSRKKVYGDEADIQRRWLEVKALAAQETDSPLQRRLRELREQR
jgi:hypothetical protein